MLAERTRFRTMSDFIWKPLAGARRARERDAAARGASAPRAIAELHRISVEEPDRFWPALVDDLGIEFSQPWTAVVDISRGPEWATWFNGGALNVARCCLHRWAARAGRRGARRPRRGRRARVADLAEALARR